MERFPNLALWGLLLVFTACFNESPTSSSTKGGYDLVPYLSKTNFHSAIQYHVRNHGANAAHAGDYSVEFYLNWTLVNFDRDTPMLLPHSASKYMFNANVAPGVYEYRIVVLSNTNNEASTANNTVEGVLKLITNSVGLK